MAANFLHSTIMSPSQVSWSRCPLTFTWYHWGRWQQKWKVPPMLASHAFTEKFLWKAVKAQCCASWVQSNWLLYKPSQNETAGLIENILVDLSTNTSRDNEISTSWSEPLHSFDNIWQHATDTVMSCSHPGLQSYREMESYTSQKYHGFCIEKNDYSVTNTIVFLLEINILWKFNLAMTANEYY